MWKLICGLTTFEQGEEDPFEGRNNNDENNDKEDDKEKETNIEEEDKRKMKTWQ